MASRAFARHDESDDAHFYSQPRLVNHIEAGAIEALRAGYDALLPSGRILDLMSSWRSHLPHGRDSAHRFDEVVGLGMNSVEMSENPQLDRHVVHDLNRDPVLPFDDDVFDGIVCTVSVQYLTRPHEVFDEVRRVATEGAPFVCAFSNRCFPTKAVAIWQVGDDLAHCELVRSYLEVTGFDSVDVRQLPSPDDPIFVAIGTA